MHRRDLMARLPIALFCLSAAARSVPAATTGDLDYTDYDGPLPPVRLFGNGKPRPEEEVQAQRILDAATCPARVLQIARYFEGITAVNADGERYNAAWAKRWNPVIVQFYRATLLGREYVLQRGDTIAWCAAFLNWTLACAGKPTTQCASSSCFRTYGTATDSPKPGDIVVFRHAQEPLAKQGFGHVGLFLSSSKNSIEVLGGNQAGGKGYSSVCRSVFPVKDDHLWLHSFRVIPRGS